MNILSDVLSAAWTSVVSFPDPLAIESEAGNPSRCSVRRFFPLSRRDPISPTICTRSSVDALHHKDLIMNKLFEILH